MEKSPVFDFRMVSTRKQYLRKAFQESYDFAVVVAWLLNKKPFVPIVKPVAPPPQFPVRADNHANRRVLAYQEKQLTYEEVLDNIRTNFISDIEDLAHKQLSIRQSGRLANPAYRQAATPL